MDSRVEVVCGEVIAWVRFGVVARAYPPQFFYVVKDGGPSSFGLPQCWTGEGVLNTPALIGESSAVEARSLSHWGGGGVLGPPPYCAAMVCRLTANAILSANQLGVSSEA